jgi:hypothetical protein
MFHVEHYHGHLPVNLAWVESLEQRPDTKQVTRGA